MIATFYQQIMNDLLEFMAAMAEDWEYGGDIGPDTYMFAHLGFESLDLVVLGTSIQERYGRLPFAEFLAEIGQRPERDVTVGELVSFVCDNLSEPVGRRA